MSTWGMDAVAQDGMIPSSFLSELIRLEPQIPNFVGSSAQWKTYSTSRSIFALFVKS